MRVPWWLLRCKHANTFIGEELEDMGEPEIYSEVLCSDCGKRIGTAVTGHYGEGGW